MVQSLENTDKSKVYASRIEGLATVATSGDYNDLSNKPTIPTDSNLVHKTGDETISGLKKFTSSIQKKHTTMDIDTNPSSELTNQIWFVDKNNTNYATLQTLQKTNGTMGLVLTLKSKSTNEFSSLGINQLADGTAQTYAPTPDTSNNSTQIATTAFVKAQGYKTTDNDTKNTAGGDDTSSKIFLVGMTAQTSSNGSARTYTHDTVYVNTSGQLESSTPNNSSNTTVVATTAFVKSVLSTSGAGLYTISKSGNGYCKFNSGLIIQWGSKSITSEAQQITYPTAFPTVARPCLCMVVDSDAGYVAYIGSFSLTSFTVRRHGSDSQTVNWIAIGY